MPPRSLLSRAVSRAIPRSITVPAVLATLSACTVVDRENRVYPDPVPVVFAAAETTPVPSMDDAADDPAIWINTADPSASRVIGTDKDSGVGTWRLDGSEVAFLPDGLPNNIDLRQGVAIGGMSLDLAAASNRDRDRVSLYEVSASGVRPLGEFPSDLPEPYGSCMAIHDDDVHVIVTYKTGEIVAWQLESLEPVSARRTASFRFESQLEGCVHDDATDTLFVGEEARGIWRMSFPGFSNPVLVDEVDGDSGTTADIEGLAIYRGEDSEWLIASSQGNDSYAVYTLSSPHRFMGRFRIDGNERIDGAQETDGIEASGAYLGPDYPRGMLVVQDGFNAPRGSAQNFKIVDWRDIEAALGL